jgi:hypothetical protein
VADVIERLAAAMWQMEERVDGTGVGARFWTWEQLPPGSQAYWRAKARAAWAYALARLREPSAAMLDAVAARKPWIGHPEARPESVARYHRGVRQAAAADMATMLQAFAREHGLEEPPP